MNFRYNKLSLKRLSEMKDKSQRPNVPIRSLILQYKSHSDVYTNGKMAGRFKVNTAREKWVYRILSWAGAEVHTCNR